MCQVEPSSKLINTIPLIEIEFQAIKLYWLPQTSASKSYKIDKTFNGLYFLIERQSQRTEENLQET